MKHDEKENKEKSKLRRFLRAAKWVVLVMVVLFVVIQNLLQFLEGDSIVYIS